MVGVVPLLIFFNEASINTFLFPALDFFNLLLRSGIETRVLTFRFQFHVHLDQFFTRQCFTCFCKHFSCMSVSKENV